VTDKGHADTFQRTEPQTSGGTPQPGKTEQRATDNEAQAARAEAEREFTVGGGTEVAPPAAALPAERLAAAIARTRAFDRPSPFGTGHFPPLPVPPGVDSDR
jgi:hypothetical protein